MSWYYAENNDRRGPIEETVFEELLRNGTIKPETLVWREGMANWLPYAQASGSVSPAGGVVQGGASGVARCSSCGNYFPESDLITIAGRAICATCKPRVVQQMVEGADAAGSSIDPAKLLAEVRARGGYPLNVGSVISRAWETVKKTLWPSIGTTLLSYLVLGVATSIPCLGLIAACFVTGPVFGGLYFYFLRKHRGEPALVGDAFAGFNKPHFGQLALAGTVQTVSTLAIMGLLIWLPAIILSVNSRSSQAEPALFIVLYLIAAVPLIYLTLSWILAYAFIVDKRLPFWDAMELSRKLVAMRFWSWFLLLIVNGLLTLAGVLALCVGIIFVMPIYPCAIMVVYEDIVNAAPPQAT